MMSRRRVLAVATISVAASACVASSGASSSSWFNQPQSAATSDGSGGSTGSGDVATGALSPRQQGPRVSLYAEVSAPGGARHVRANFHLDDDAYVLVGHIDADGVLRISFPDAPTDNGFTRGHANYQTADFFAGFNGQYRARFTTGDYQLLNGAAAVSSYDGGLGYVFIIASWQPMQFDRFSTAGEWDSFELTSADYLRDPRPAVYELASLLAGANPEQYTVKFASVYDTRSTYGDFGGGMFADSYGGGLCSGFGYGFTFGFASSPFGYGLSNPLYRYAYGESFWYRGSRYAYSALDDCYYSVPTFSPSYPYGYYGWSVAQAPTAPGNPSGRFITRDRIHSPIHPETTPVHLAPGGATDVGGTTSTQASIAEPESPKYRTRGLIVHQDPTGGEALAPRSPAIQVRGRDTGGDREQPMAHGMVIRPDGGSSPGAQSGNDGVERRVPVTRGETPMSSAPRIEANSPRTESPRVDAPRTAPTPRVETPRAESPHFEAPRSAPAPRVEAPAPRMEAPRVEAPRVEAPRSEPARSPPPASSSSSGKPPGSKN